MTALPRTISDAADALRSGSLSCIDLTRGAIEAADRLDSQLGIYLHRRDEQALDDAERADADFARGVDRGPLQGIPVGIKDVVATADEPTTAQSLVLDPGWGAGVDAAVVARLRAAGAIVTGKTTLMEFHAGCPDPEKPFPIPRNPWDPSRWAGGSSSGTASGVATGCFLGGIGTDTLGSIRGPAAFTGVSGIKPTFGRVPKTGVVPAVWSFDTVGPLARSSRDCALLLDAIAGHEPADPQSSDVSVPGYAAGLDGSISGLRIGVERTHHTHVAGTDASALQRYDEALNVLASAGAELVDVTIPTYDEVRTAAIVVVLCEALTYHRDRLQARWSDYGTHTRLLFGAGAFFTGPDLVQAKRVLATASRQVAAIFDEVDLIVSPTAGVGAPPIEGLSVATLLGLPMFTLVWNGLRNPALSVPVGLTDDGLPVGMQLIGRPWDEATVLRAGDAYQRLTDWHLRLPPLAETSTART